MKDHKNDCVVTTFTLISVLLTRLNIYWFDSVVGIGISLWICYTGVTIFMESYNVLMDISIDDKTKKQIYDICQSYSEIQKVKDIISVPVGNQYLVFITICVNGSMTTLDSHNLADSLENSVTRLDKVYRTVVHVEPCK